MTPAWFSNMSMEWTLAERYRHDPWPYPMREPEHYEFLVELLRCYAPAIHEWIDANLCAGSPIVRETYDRYLSICDWSQLEHDHAAADIVAVFKRLQGLR